MGMPPVIQYAGRRTSGETGKTLQTRLLHLFTGAFAHRPSGRSRLDARSVGLFRKYGIIRPEEPDLSVGDDLFR